MAKPTKPRRRRSIMILGTKVKIKYTKKDLYDEGDLLHGAFDANTMTIHISLDSDVHATLLHEALHAVLAVSGTSNLIPLKTEEAIVYAIESGLKDYFKF